MPRSARVVIPGSPHHITQRGNNRQQVFFTDDDRRLYLWLLREHCELHGTRIWAYCLMPNHVHLIAVPGEKESLALTIGQAHNRYSHYVNRTYERSGHLWQGRYYSDLLGDDHLINAMKYVELNPVRARLVDDAWDYRWSSASAHCGGEDFTRLVDSSVWARRYPAASWKAILRQTDDVVPPRELASG